MNLYSKKQFWKYALGLIALVIIGVSFWYTSFLASKIEREERSKLTIWAEAIQKKANLVKFTAELFRDLSDEERKKVELWAEATRKLASDAKGLDYNFLLKVVSNNTTVPVILTDESGTIISHRNLEITNPSKLDLQKELSVMKIDNTPITINIYGEKRNYLYYKNSNLFSDLKQTMDDMIKSFISEIVINSASVPVLFVNDDLTQVISSGNIKNNEIETPEELEKTISEMNAQNTPIEIDLGNNEKSYVYFKDSELLNHLKYYPFVQFAIIGLFMFVSYWLFSIARKSEQNQVWVGMAKETAHQLGTPLSSLLAWIEILKAEDENNPNIEEMKKDISRLEMITDRFSKIGSDPVLNKLSVLDEINHSINYLSARVSKKVVFKTTTIGASFEAYLNTALFSWVIENLIKNAVDSMQAEGNLNITISEQKEFIEIDVSDSGKGIPSSKLKTVFEPGYTTKQRGWGLGLSLAKRIIEDYHNGKIFVKSSQIDIGTTFRIVLNK